MRSTRRLGIALCAIAGMGAVPAAAQARDMFVPNYNDQTISVVDTTTNQVIHTINVGSGGPWGLAVSPDGKIAYDVNYDSNTMIPITVDTYDQGSAITLPGGTTGQPYQVAITPDGTKAYVAESGTGTVVPVDLTDDTAGRPISVGSGPYFLAITPNGKTVYVSVYNSNQVVPISTATDTAGPPIAVTSPEGLAVTPSGTSVWVQTDSGDLIPISTANNAAGTPITGPSAPSDFGLAISPNGNMAYWANGNNSVTPFNLSTRTVGSTFTVDGDPEYPTLTPSGATLYTSNYAGNSLTPISTHTNKAGSAIAVGSGPGQLGIVPNQGPTAAFESTANGLTVTLNATASSDPDGTVAKYAWGFGDGTHATTTSAIFSHTYSNAGSYTIKLTVIDNEGCSNTKRFTGQTMYCNGSSAARTSQTVNLP